MGLSFQSVFDSAEAVNGADAVAPKELIEPIHINELMDESNTLPRETLEPIGEVARFIQSAVQEQKRAASIADVSRNSASCASFRPPSQPQAAGEPAGRSQC